MGGIGRGGRWRWESHRDEKAGREEAEFEAADKKRRRRISQTGGRQQRQSDESENGV